MCEDSPDLQKKPSHNGISRLILSLRTGLTMKPAEDIVMVLRNLACRLTTLSQWQLAAGKGYLELLGASLNHRFEEVRACAFVVIMESLLSLSAPKTADDPLPYVTLLLKLAREFVESRGMDSSLSCSFLKTMGSLCSLCPALRDEVFKAISLPTLQFIKPGALSSEALTQFTFVLRDWAAQGVEESSVVGSLFGILEEIVASRQLSCAICSATCATLSMFMKPFRNENVLFWLGSTKLMSRLSEHVASANCSDACSDIYIELTEGILLVEDAGFFFIGSYGLDALHAIIFERFVASVPQLCEVLAKLLVGPPNQISLVVHFNLLSPLVILLAESDAQIRDGARAALDNFMARANFGHWYQAIQLGFVESLLLPLLSETTVVVYEAVDIFFSVMGSAKNADIDSYVLQRMLSNEMHSIFAIMLFHDDECVASMARKFFDKYFREEFVEEDVEQESSF